MPLYTYDGLDQLDLLFVSPQPRRLLRDLPGNVSRAFKAFKAGLGKGIELLKGIGILAVHEV